MKTLFRTLIITVGFPACLACAQTKPTAESAKTAPEPGSANALWQKVNDAMEGMQAPRAKPKTREEAIKIMTDGLNGFDKAVAEFLTKYPQDARRWEAQLFNATTLNVRGRIGMEVKGTLPDALKEILAAPDASAQIKGDASAILLLESADDAQSGTIKLEDWIAGADKHLKEHPASRLNEAVSQKLAALKSKAEMRTKPLDLKFTAVDGTEVDLAKLRGKVVLIDFWATWCGPCVAELPNVLKAYEKLHDKGFEIVGISLDQSKEKLEAFAKDRGMKWPQYFDGKGWENEISRRFGIQSIPAMWLVNKKGMLVSEDVRGRLEELVEKELKE